ncbi:hypothetical protein ESA94_20555 [Lacibacter luteus]|uniref:Uncharacterized protein n=1 Tax=Lacibacter luteus TaxID=2508719 RepID=A0A4Q1CE01_9BACT|nr:hypothetical protein [Lacibacter luteus]RXK57592.1 hypothetical protein ESA94_20555 [Lacibacter luteus]
MKKANKKKQYQKNRRPVIVSILFLFSFLQLLISSCNTEKKLVKKVYAFQSPRQQGNIPVDPSGNELPLLPDTFYTAYVVTVKKVTRFDSAWYRGKRFSVSANLITGNSAEVGLEKGSLTKPLLITTENTSALYSLQLTVDRSAISPQKTEDGVMLIRFFKGKRAFYQQIERVEAVEQLPAN